jgi:Fe-S-cluster containining protein
MLMLQLNQAFNDKLVPYLDALIDIYAAMDRAYNLAALHYGFKCTGCDDNCCYTRFYHYTYIEYGYILKGYRLLDGHKSAEVRKRALKVIGDSKATDKKELAERYMCPLNFDGRCILYAYRPMICRLHGIPHEFQTSNHNVIYAPGCDSFTGQHGDTKYFSFDRTPFYTQMTRLESELKQAMGIDNKLKMTIAEMIASF